MNKKYLIAGGVVFVVFIIFVIFLFFQLNTSQQQHVPQPSTLKNQNPAALQQPHTTKTTAPSPTFSPPSSTPQEAVRQFYQYYFASPVNPLAYGAYKSNPYLSTDFKQVIKALYNNGNVPVFCPQNKRAHIVVGKETPVNYTNAILMQEVISEAPPGNKELYRVLVKEVNNKWLIYDINCIY